MKCFRLANVCGLTALVLLAQSSPELKHLPVAPQQGATAVTVSARDIEREARYPSVIHLTGSVEIKMPVCMRPRPNEMTCDGEMVLRADEADFHEDTGRIEARGNVSLTPTHRK